MAKTQILERPEDPFASKILAIAGMRLVGGPEYLTTPCAFKVTICLGVNPKWDLLLGCWCEGCWCGEHCALARGEVRRCGSRCVVG
jgi:hypothetical protein